MKAIKLGTTSINDCKTVEVPDENILNWMYEQIECDCIETVRPRDYPEWILVIDGEGLWKPNHLNVLASVMYGTPEHDQPIVGNALLMRVDFVNGERDIVGLTDEEVEKAYKMLDKVFIKAQWWAMKVRRERNAEQTND